MAQQDVDRLSACNHYQTFAVQSGCLSGEYAFEIDSTRVDRFEASVRDDRNIQFHQAPLHELLLHCVVSPNRSFGGWSDQDHPMAPLPQELRQQTAHVIVLVIVDDQFRGQGGPVHDIVRRED